MTSLNHFEQPPQKPNSEEMKLLKFICEKVCGYYDFFEADYMRIMAETRLGYTEEECDVIDGVLSQLPEVIHEELKKADSRIVKDNDVGHIIGNSPLALQATVEKRIKKKLENIKDNPGVIPQDSSNVIPLYESATVKDDKDKYIEYWIKKLDLTSEEKQIFLNFRNLRNYLLYYLDLIEQPEKREILQAEMSNADGWLKNLSHFYIKGRIPSASDSRLEHINFFARLRGFKSSLAGKISGIEKISEPIDENNFSAEFEKLKDKEFLNQKSVYRNFISRNYSRAA